LVGNLEIAAPYKLDTDASLIMGGSIIWAMNYTTTLKIPQGGF